MDGHEYCSHSKCTRFDFSSFHRDEQCCINKFSKCWSRESHGHNTPQTGDIHVKVHSSWVPASESAQAKPSKYINPKQSALLTPFQNNFAWLQLSLHARLPPQISALSFCLHLKHCHFKLYDSHKEST